MKIPVLQPGEEWLVKSPDVYVKSLRFTACLTSVRIILISPDNDMIPDRDLALVSVAGIDFGESHTGEPYLVVLARTRGGAMKRLVLTFAGRPGISRKGERDSWIQWISRYGQLHASSTPGSPVMDPAPGQARADPVVDPTPWFPGNPGTRVNGSHAREKSRIVPSFIGMSSDGDSRGPGAPGSPAVRGTNASDIAVQEIPPPIMPVPPAAPAPVQENPGVFASFFCMACGNRVPAGAKFCNRCGATVIPPGNEVVRSPWDPGTPVQDPATLAARWGVPVAPGQVSVPPGYYANGQFPAAGQPVAASFPQYPPGAGRVHPEQQMHVPGSGFPVRTAALVAVIIVFAGIMAAATWGLFPGSGIFGDPSAGSATDDRVVDDRSPVAADNNLQEVATLAPDAESSDTSGTSTAPSALGTTSISIPPSGTYLRVAGPGTWEGTYGAIPAIWAVRGTGEKVYEVDDSSGSLSASFLKSDVSASDLVVELYKDGRVIKSGNTAIPSGSVTLVAGL